MRHKLVATYTLMGPVHDQVSYPIWVDTRWPEWVHRVQGVAVAWQCMAYCAWRRMVLYGTPAEHWLAGVLITMLARSLGRLVS